MKRVIVLLMLFGIMCPLIMFPIANGMADAKPLDFETITYVDIPGVTQEEIAAIEKLKSERSSFSYGHLVETEAFVMPDGTYAGFTTEFCQVLSKLFGIEFVQEFYEWNDLKSRLDNKEVDFTGELTPTDERMLVYNMTHPIAERPMRIFQNVNSPEVNFETDLNGLKLGFLHGSIDAESVANAYPALSYQVVDCTGFEDAAKKLQSNEIDVFVTEGVVDPAFDEYDYIHSKEFFPLVFTSVAMTTANSEFAPIISVVDKYLVAGGIDKLFTLYKEGDIQYAFYKLNKSFTDEEKNYINSLLAQNAKIKIALEPDNYPVSFYNSAEKEFQGIAVDVLAEISKFLGVEFETTTTPKTTWMEILDQLTNGEVTMVSQLLYSDARKDQFLWASKPYCSTSYALLSKTEFSNLSSYQVLRARVGVVKKSVNETMYNKWFPKNENAIGYNTQNEALNALEKGEIDLLMASEYMLLAQSNYREKSGYKINMRFSAPMDSQFGFHIDETVLCSIISKTQQYVDTGLIAGSWTSRTFDYSKKLATERNYFLMGFVFVLLLILILTVVLLFSNRRLSRNLEDTVKKRTFELERQTTTLSTIYTSIPDLIFCKDLNGLYTSCNLSFEKYTGINEADMIGKNDIEVFHRDGENMGTMSAAASNLAEDQLLLAHQQTIVKEEVITYPDGTRYTVETMKMPLIASTGECVGLMGISRDITHRKETEEMLKLTLDNLDTCIYINDINTRKLLFVNDKMANEFGGGDFVDKICWKAFQKEFTKPCDFCLITRLLESGDDYYVWEEHNSITGRYYKNTDSLIKWYDGRTVHMRHSVDITDSIHLQQELETTVAKLEMVVNNYSGLIWSIDENRIIRLFDGLYLKKIGADSSAFEGKSIHSATDISKSLSLMEMVEHTFDSGPQEHISRVGNDIFRSRTSPIKDKQGKTIGVVGDTVDVTEMIRLQSELRAAIEAAENASKAKGDFLSRMSHEIRTPLNAILGMIGIAMGSDDMERIKHCLDRAEGASKQLLGIINDILDMSKIEADKFELESREFEFEKMLMNITNVTNFRADEKHQNLVVNLKDNVPAFIIADEIRLSQVITNLLTNAVKFTQENGTVTLSIETIDENEDAITLRVEVADNGIGISEEQQKRLFTSFEQADGSISRKFGGTGLGLAISKRIVELMDGKIWIESELGKGSKFIFNVKAKKGKQKAVSKLSAKIRRDNLHILAVDDSAETRNYLASVCASHELPCDVAASGAEALEKIVNCGDKPYNIIFVDWMMPEMNGIELTKRIKALQKDNAVMIMISAAEWSTIEEEAVAAGVSCFISKPLFPSNLIDAINGCISVERRKPADAQSLAEGNRNFAGHTILIAEDVEVNREIMSAVLEETSIAIDFAENGAKAVSMFEAQPDKYSLILMDIQMPEMDGMTATHTIRALKTQIAKEIPIIAMTANVFREDIENCMAAGMNDHIGKPVDPDGLYEKLDQYLSQRKVIMKETDVNTPAAAKEPLDYTTLLPAIDVQDGVKRLMNNEKLYFKLLKSFKGREMADGLIENINEGDTQKIAAAAHTLKGVASNLSLPEIVRVTLAIEAQAKAGTASTQWIDSLNQAVDEAVVAIDKLLEG